MIANAINEFILVHHSHSIQQEQFTLHFLSSNCSSSVIVGYCATRLVNDACDVKVKSETQAKGVKTGK